MRKIITILGLILIVIIIIVLGLDPKGFNNNIINTLSIWLFKVYPSLFTFYVISSILLNLGIINYISRFLYNKKFLHFNSSKMFDLFLLSIISGNPTSSSLIINGLESNDISKKDSEKLLMYSSFLSPLFIIAFIDNIYLSIAIIFSHILANFIIVIIINKNNNFTYEEKTGVKINLQAILTSIVKAVEILLMVAAIMCFCNIIIYSFNYLFNLLKINNLFLKVMLSFVEISTGTYNILNLPIINEIKLIILVFLFGFGGLSIHLQVYIIIKGKTKYLTFLLGRILQGVISVIIFCILYYFFW